MRTPWPLGFSRFLALCLVVQLFSPVSTGAEQDDDVTHVLLVGNSILYTNNLPAILTEISSANGKRLTVDMFARGGAQISDLLSSDATFAIQNGSYDVVVFHDRGGDALCAATDDSLEPGCIQMIDDHRQFADLISSSDSIPYLLGTYQPSDASLRLIQGEQRIADEIGITHIEISEKWNKAMSVVNDAPWLAEDGMHPGKALSALIAIEIYRAIFANYPSPIHISTTVPLDIPQDKLKNVVALKDLPEEEAKEVLSKEQFKNILAVLNSEDST